MRPNPAFLLHYAVFLAILTCFQLFKPHFFAPQFDFGNNGIILNDNGPRLTSLSRPQKRMSNKELVREVRKWKNPKYAKDRIKIYYYDLPSSFNQELVDLSHRQPPPIRDPHCNESFYSAENTLSLYFKNSPVRTYNASAADYFFVPVLTTCYLMMNQPNDIKKSGKFFAKAMNYVMNKYPYWNRSDGRDHIFMFAQGFGARLAGDWAKYRNAIFLVHNGDYKESHFSPAKDIVVPPDLSNYFSPIWLEQPVPRDKNHFGFFGGSVVSSTVNDHRGSNYSEGVRQYFQEHLSKRKGYKITGARSDTYVTDIAESIYCLCPHGWHKWSPRPAYSILLGCIPVMISQEQQLFLENLIDYNDISVWVRPKNVATMNKKLLALKPIEIQKRQTAMRLVWPLFWYGQDGLAGEAVLYSLYQKMEPSRPHRNFL